MNQSNQDLRSLTRAIEDHTRALGKLTKALETQNRIQLDIYRAEHGDDNVASV